MRRPPRKARTAWAVAVFEQLGGARDGLVERDRAGAEAEVGVDPLVEDGLGAGADRAGEGEGRAAQ